MNKQINELRKEVSCIHRFFLEDDDYENLDDYIADMLYNAGYRRQDEVAREIFADLEEALDYYATNIKYNEFESLEFHGGLMCAIDSMFNIIAELKKRIRGN